MTVSPLRSDEVELAGSWSWADGKAKTDEVSERIEGLIRYHLARLGTDPSGWDVLFRDPSDGRLWELTYQLSSGHGAGPPHLRVITFELAIEKYGDLS